MANSYLTTSSDVQAKNVTATFSKLTGVVTLTFESRNPRLESGKVYIYYKGDGVGASYVQLTNFFTPTSGSSSSTHMPFSNGSKWKQQTITWDIYKSFNLANQGNKIIKLVIKDDDDVIAVELVANTLSIDLTPPNANLVSPKDFGKDLTPDFLWFLPVLLRSQNITPKLTISTTADFSSGNVSYTNYSVENKPKGNINQFVQVSANSVKAVASNHGMNVGDKVSIYNGTNKAGDFYNDTFTITAKTISSFTFASSAEVQADAKADFNKSAVQTFGASSGNTISYNGGQNQRITIRFQNISALTNGTTYYTKLDLQCSNP